MIKGRFEGVFTIQNYEQFVTGGLWFLWSSYLCSLVVSGINNCLKDKLVSYAFVVLAVLLLPNSHNFYLVKFTLPFFVGGYLYHKFAERLRPAQKWAIYLSCLVFPALIVGWQTKYYIYTTGISFDLLHADGLGIVMDRYAKGVFGLIFFIAVVRKILFPVLQSVIVNMGKQSLGIYVIGLLITIILVPMVHFSSASFFLYSFVLTPLLAVAIIGISYLATIIISKIPLFNRYLLGGRS
jgi:hypothetical protein